MRLLTSGSVSRSPYAMMYVMKWGGTRYRVPLILGGLAVLVGATVWMLAGGGRGAEVATVLSLTVAVLALAVTVFGVPWQRTRDTHTALAEAARSLARQVGQREAA